MRRGWTEVTGHGLAVRVRVRIRIRVATKPSTPRGPCQSTAAVEYTNNNTTCGIFMLSLSLFVRVCGCMWIGLLGVRDVRSYFGKPQPNTKEGIRAVTMVYTRCHPTQYDEEDSDSQQHAQHADADSSYDTILVGSDVNYSYYCTIPYTFFERHHVASGRGSA
eukprot:scaffold17279_cov247-Amphora_coffeaeformis.AAC.1